MVEVITMVKEQFIQCPYCNHENNTSDFVSWFLYEEEIHNVKCYKCKKDFKVESTVKLFFNVIKD